MPYMLESKEAPMPKPQIEAETARLEARIPVQVYDQMQRAARLRGMTLTGYLISTAGEDARRVVEDADIMRLAREDQIRFAEALINPPQPNARLARAAKRHAELIERRYFRETVSQDVKRKYATCFVARDIATDRVAGFYTLSSSNVPLTEVPEPMATRLPRYPTVPAVLIGWLGRHSDYAGQGL
eukprot:gene14224-16576_t